jgi:hypothetical protein
MKILKTNPYVPCIAWILTMNITCAWGQSLQEGLEIHIPFDEGKGNVAEDLSGNARSMVPETEIFPGAVVNWSGGRFGGSAKFNYDYFMIAPDYYGVAGDTARTISFWVRTGPGDQNPAGAQGAVIGWGINATGQRMHVKFHGTFIPDEGIIRQYPRTENQGGNNIGDQHSFNDGQWHHFVSVFDPEVDSNGDGIFAAIGDFDHYIDGQLDTKRGGVGNPMKTNINAEEGAQPLSVGGSYFLTRMCDTRIDDFRVYSRALSLDEIQALGRGDGVDGPPAVDITNQVEGAEFFSVDTPIEFKVTPNEGAFVMQKDIFLELNGKDVSQNLITEGNTEGWTGRFASLEPNKVYHGRIGATDSKGRSYAFDFYFDTIVQDNYAIEAEDFNFDGGTFFNDPLPCDDIIEPTSQCYYDRVSESGIDIMDSVDDDRPSDEDVDYETFLYNSYRFGQGGFREEEGDTWVSGDNVRAKYSDDAFNDLREFDLERVQTGEWYNYTRDLPEGIYHVLLRARSTGSQTLSLGSVEGASATDQSHTENGRFHVEATGGSYRFFPLLDESGREVILDGVGEVETLRLSAVEADGNVELNYLMLIPAVIPVIPPMVPSVEISANGNQIVLQWEGQVGQLQRSTKVTGPWENVTTSGNTYTEQAEGDAAFYRMTLP